MSRHMFRDMAETLQDRLRARIAELGTSGRKVSMEAGLSPDFVRGILRNEGQSPRGQNLSSLARVLGTTEHWLLHGDGASPSAPALRAEPGPPVAPDVEPVAALNLAALQAAMPQNMPVYGTVAASFAVRHEGAFEMESRVIEYVRRPPALFSVPDAYAFYVAGSSMVPAHMPGEVRFVHPYKPPRRGDTVVVQARYSPDRGVEAFLGIFDRQNADTLYIRKLNPESTVEFAARYVTAVHRVLTMNEMFGI